MWGGVEISQSIKVLATKPCEPGGLIPEPTRWEVGTDF